MKNKKKTAKPETNRVAIGIFAMLLRPNLWAGHHCRVEDYDEAHHIVRVFAPRRSSFLAWAKFEELEVKSRELEKP